MSSAFSWNPNGVSSMTAGTGGGPSRSNSPRWTLPMVGLVSPDPMMTNSRGTAVRLEEVRLRKGPVQEVGQLHRVLQVEVVVAGREPLHTDVR